jgi:anthranilate phosphoribosyltransferase
MGEILQETLIEFRAGRDLNADIAATLFDALVTETTEDTLVELFRTWNSKGISEGEIFAFASIMRERMRRITPKSEIFIDAVGTGGSRAKTFNVSTAATFVIAGAEVPIAKHGNRAASSKTGSADVLSELGVRVDVEPEVSEKCINELGLCFMFAPKFHSLSPALANARRRLLGEPTIFNCVGPLCNPAGAPHQLIGAWDREIARKMANVLARLGTKKSWVVHGDDGLDEITLSGRTFVYEICRDNVREFEIDPRDLGLELVDVDSLPRASTSSESAELIRAVLENNNTNNAAETLVVINAAAAIFLAGAADSLKDAFAAATESIRSDSASKKLKALAAMTNK